MAMTGHAGVVRDSSTMPPTAIDRTDHEPAAAGNSLFVTAQDGLRLHVHAWGSRSNRALPVVCLPGLARTTADFDTLAAALSSDREHPRPVLALDYRGRGKSDYDRKPANYNLQVELADVLSVLTALGIGQAAFVGTSRGGILTMLLAVARPAAIAGCVLNDIGPVIDLEGLVRIKSYVGKLPQLPSFPAAADALKRRFSSQFPRWSQDDWLAFARATFKEAGGQLVPDYDPKLATILEAIGPAQPLPTLWKEFDALGRVPVMVIRGANSDILSAATVEAMRKRRRALDVVEVPDEGHAPRLAGSLTIGRIAAFIASCDAAARDTEAS
jgi:pimeloyl-ACP methyl ester carboxylesterase